MESKLSVSSVLNLADEIGHFIEYWGFKKIHGKVWTLIFLAQRPVDANYLIESLTVSKSLISMTLKDLIEYKVIVEAEKNGPTHCYKANLNIKDVIFDVLSKREVGMLLKIKAACNLIEISSNQKANMDISEKRTQQMSEMIDIAESLLTKIIALKDVSFVPLLNKLNFKE